MLEMSARRVAACAGAVVALAATVLGGSPAKAGAAGSPASQPRAAIACPRDYVCIYPDINFGGQPYVSKVSRSHLPDSIRSAGSSVINNSSRTARVYQKDNYSGRHVCVGRNGGSIGDLRSYQINDSTHSLRVNDTACGA